MRRRVFFLACGGILIVSVIAWIASGLLIDWGPFGGGGGSLESPPTTEALVSYRNLHRINTAAYRFGVGTFALMAAGYMMDMLDLLWPGSED